jgi:3-oxoacyl-[acyl-carrier protein] reductase
MGELEGRVALVTGSSRGIGSAIARLFAAEGAAVVVQGRDSAAATSVIEEIRRDGGRGLSALCDLTVYDEIEAMREHVEAELGPTDILVANAGGNPVPPGPVEDLTEAEWRKSVDANLTATFLTVKAFLPSMKERGRGAIVMMSSAAARRPTVQSPVAYAAAKAGIELLTKSLALQAGPAGIRVNCIAPETILTERNERQIPDAIKEQLRLTHPIQRLGTPDDVAQAALYLVSDRAGLTSGVTIDVAGGSVLA